MPLNILQSITFCPKYQIKNNFITPNCRLIILVSFVLSVLSILIVIGHLVLTFLFPKVPTLVLFTTCYDCLLYCTGFSMNFVICFKYSEENINFVLTFQDIHRFLNDKSNFRQFTIWCWVILVFTLCFILISYICFFVTQIIYFTDLASIVVMVFDIQIIYAMKVMELLASKVDLWNLEAMKTQDLNKADALFYHKKLFEAFCNIIECYDLYKATYQYSVSTKLNYVSNK